MGTVVTQDGSGVEITEVEGKMSVADVYADMRNSQYTDVYRLRMIEACGKLGRKAYGALPGLHDIAKSLNIKLAAASKEAIRLIDPGSPLFGSATKTSSVSGNTQTAFNSSYPPVVVKGKVAPRKLEMQKVTITDIPGDLSDGNRIYGTCSFCEKHTLFPKSVREMAATLVPESQIYCTFCMRREYYLPKFRRNTLIMSFRGLIGYYYYCFHYNKQAPSLWVADIQAMADNHVKIGIQNPLMHYDPETFCWFVDFSRIGPGYRKASVDTVLESVSAMLLAFNLYDMVKGANTAPFFEKFRLAILDFHHHRRRPGSQRLLIPTLYNCGIPTDMAKGGIPVGYLRNFMGNQLVDGFRTNNHRARGAACGM